MLTPETITSAANPLLKDVRRAIARGALTAEGWCVAETFHLLEEALRSRCAVKTVLPPKAARRRGGARPAPGRRAWSVLPTRCSPNRRHRNQPGRDRAGPAADWKLEQLFRGRSLVVVLDGLQDPGNAGTIVRAAEAFGATGVMFLKGTVEPVQSENAARLGRIALPRALRCTAWTPPPRARRCSRTGVGLSTRRAVRLAPPRKPLTATWISPAAAR